MEVRTAAILGLATLLVLLFASCSDSSPSGVAPIGTSATPSGAISTPSGDSSGLSCADYPIVDGLREGTFELETESFLIVQSFLAADYHSPGVLYPKNGVDKSTIELSAEPADTAGPTLRWTLRREEHPRNWTDRDDLPPLGYGMFLSLPAEGCWRFTVRLGSQEVVYSTQVLSEPLEIEPQFDLNHGEDCGSRAEWSLHRFFAALNQGNLPAIAELFPSDQPWRLEVGFRGLLSDSAFTENDYLNITDERDLVGFLGKVDGMHFLLLQPVFGPPKDATEIGGISPIIWRSRGGKLLDRLGLEFLEGGGKATFDCAAGTFNRLGISSLS